MILFLIFQQFFSKKRKKPKFKHLNYYLRMSFKKLLVILTFVCLQAKLNALRPLDSLKKPISPLKSIQVVHYVVRNPDKTLRIESVGVKNIKINYNREWLAKSTWDDSYNKTG
jgi:hypothetical protein